MLRTSDLDYELPRGLIATAPAEPRDSARLLVVSRSDESRMEHRVVRDLPQILARGDLMVFNTTRVMPARIVGRRAETGGRFEGLFLDERTTPQGREWTILLHGRRLKPGVALDLRDADDRPSGIVLHLLGNAPGEPGGWIARVTGPGSEAGAPAILERIGVTPLPPYILKARDHAHLASDDTRDRAGYQTVYARPDQAHSVAAPTAGLHFTPDLLDRLSAAGIERTEVILHVGVATFRPIASEYVEKHDMHAERFFIPAEAWARISAARREGRRVVCVGSTAARAVETRAAQEEEGRSPEGWTETRLLIAPGYGWRATDVLMTNFHLPCTTLLAMVASLFPGGIERAKAIYAEAIRARYRFYSFGDAMLILP